MKQNSLVSIVVTTKNEEKNIKNCLESIKKQTYSPIEIIVVDNKSTDKTKEIAKKYTDKVYDKGPERSAQRNYGAAKAKGKYLLFLDCDMVIERNVVEDCVRTISTEKSFLAIVIPEKSFGEGFWAKCKALERSFYVGVDWMEAARFFRKDIFDELRGYDESNTGTEDYDLPQRLQSRYGKKSIGRVSSFILHNEGKLSLRKTLLKKYYYSRTLGVYISKKHNNEYYKKQSSLVRRYLLYFSDYKRLMMNPVVGIGMLFMKTAEFVAGGLGYFGKKYEKNAMG